MINLEEVTENGTSKLGKSVCLVLDRQGKEDVINHPTHYCKGKLECKDVQEAVIIGYDGIEIAHVWNIVKYLYRAPFKGGSESLKKARWYLDRLIEAFEKNDCR